MPVLAESMAEKLCLCLEQAVEWYTEVHPEDASKVAEKDIASIAKANLLKARYPVSMLSHRMQPFLARCKGFAFPRSQSACLDHDTWETQGAEGRRATGARSRLCSSSPANRQQPANGAEEAIVICAQEEYHRCVYAKSGCSNHSQESAKVGESARTWRKWGPKLKARISRSRMLFTRCFVHVQ